MLNKRFKTFLNSRISAYFKDEQMILSVSAVHGGSINSCFRIITDKGNYFLKANDPEKFPEMFESEQKGMALLNSANAFRIPECYFIGEYADKSFLLMEFVESAPTAGEFWENFASALADLHKNTSETFGLDYDNYIGSLPQVNTRASTWADFFIENRLQLQEKMARDSGKINKSTSNRFSKLYHKMADLIPLEKPSLLHGDLWSGNFLADQGMNPVIFDPAVYYGHREMDISMSLLFGGFSSDMYIHYQQKFPLESGWEERAAIWNLYPLMVHVNLFGGGYMSQVETILQRYT